MIRTIAAATLGLAAILAGNTPALADYMVYTNRATLEASLTSEQTENFNELGPNIQIFNAGLHQTGDSTSLDMPLTVSGSSGFLLSASASSLAGYYPSYGTYLLGPTTMSPTDGLTVTLPPGKFSTAGADVAIFASNSVVSFTATTTLGETVTGSVNVDGSTPGSSLGFLGVSLATPNDYLTSLTFSAPLGSGQNVVVDNFSFGNVSPAVVPEPASMALMAVGCLVLSARVFRRPRPPGVS